MQAAKRAASPLLWVPTGYFTMALGYVMLTGVIVIVFNLIADILYGVLDPRIRFD